jgi:Bacterial Ig-like domain (group 3)
MKRFCAVLSSAVTAVVACCGLVAGAGPAAGATSAAADHRAAALVGPGGTWGTALEVPGVAPDSAVNSISCASPGNCAAGGSGFVIDETNGTWGPAQPISGDVLSVSCVSAGDCAAGGNYGTWQAFVMDETAGSWGPVQEIPGYLALNADNDGGVSSVSCASPGNCVAGGYYRDASSHQQAFVTDETNGTWGAAEEVPGTAALNVDGFTGVSSVSCTAPGTCAAGGWYSDSSRDYQAYVVDEIDGSWGTAQEVPGSAALNTAGNAGVSSVSCASPGNCAAGGWSSGEVFVVDETGGTWGTAQDVPGIAALNTSGSGAQFTSVSCPSAGNCAAGGYYDTSSPGTTQAFVVDETDGTWGTAQEVPGSAALNADGYARLYTVSCVSAGNCAAGGVYTDSSRHRQAFVVDETGGSWGTAQEVPGSAALNPGGNADAYSVSCPAVGYCAAGGGVDTSSGEEAYVVNEASASSTSISLSSPGVSYGDEQAGPVSVTVTSPYGTPGGTVAVNSGTTTLCTATLASGSGSCALPATGLPAGPAQLTATYNGSTDFAASMSAAASLTVSQAASTTALSVSPATIAYGDEQTEQVSVTVSPQYAGTPAGTVTVGSGTTTLCTATLASGSGSCALPATGLPAGLAQLTATYNGSTDFAGSTSAAAPLTVIKAPAYTPVTPVRMLDTRYGIGAAKAPVGPGQTISLQVTGVDGVPSSGVTAVVLNVTATGATANSDVTVYPDGGTRPGTSNLNFTKGETIPNLVTVPVGSDGKVDFYNLAGSVNLVADLSGYYSTNGGAWLDTTGPVRVMDTRYGIGVPEAPVGPGEEISLQVTGVDGVPSSGVTAVVLNVTATGATASSDVIVFPDGQPIPGTSNLNFTRGETIPNLVIVPVGADGKVDFLNAAGSVNLVADLSGYYSTDGGAWLDTTGPVRVMDTRYGIGVAKAPVGPGESVSLQVTGVDGVPSSGVTAVVLNVTATGPTASSNVTVYPDGETRPGTSNLNFTAGETIPNLVIVPVGADGKVDFYNVDGSVNLVADLDGYFVG